VVVANLAPRKMLGLESQGMLLMAETRDGKLVPVLADSEPGSTVRRAPRYGPPGRRRRSVSALSSAPSSTTYDPA
jgi:tRNA-binding EMAP/Myf-like protein